MEAARSSGKKKADLDWGEYERSIRENYTAIYYRLAAAWPGDPRWHPDRFAKNTLTEIKEASLAELALRAREAQPIANLSHLVALVNGSKQSTIDQWNPYQRQLDVMRAKEEIPEQAAKVFMELSKEGLVPSWALKGCKISEIELAAL